MVGARFQPAPHWSDQEEATVMSWLWRLVRKGLPGHRPDMVRHDRAIRSLRTSTELSRAVRQSVATGNVVEDLVTGAYPKEGRE